jgi:DNA-binding transcriptional ArsR family regulator
MQRSTEYYEAKARAVAALANPVRLAILDELSLGPRTAGDLVRALAVAQPLVSQHLAVLRAAGVVVRERDGANRIYRLADPKIARACGLMGEIVQSIADRARAALATAPSAR